MWNVYDIDPAPELTRGEDPAVTFFRRESDRISRHAHLAIAATVLKDQRRLTVFAYTCRAVSAHWAKVATSRMRRRYTPA